MPRSSGRRSGGGQYGRRRDEEYARDGGETAERGGQDSRRGDEEYGQDGRNTQGRGDQGGEARQQGGRDSETDRLVADMAKGFVEAQAKMSGTSSGGANQEMYELMRKISRQLEDLRQPQSGGGQQQGRQEDRQGQESRQQRQQEDVRQSRQQGQQQGDGAGQSDPQAELAALFSRLLKVEKADTQQGQGQQQQGQGQQQNGSQGQQQQGQGQQQNGSQGQQAKGQKQGGGQGQQEQGQQQGQSLTAQTAAQVLAQAQYELANELEASLTKLKQVISESEKLADKISNLLGQENGSRQS